MKLSTFFGDNWIFLAIQGIVTAFICILLLVIRVEGYAVLFIGMVLILSALLIFFAVYARKREFYRDAIKCAETLDKKYLLSEMLYRPSFAEGQILYDLLRQGNKSMTDRVAEFERESNEYREYIETWVHEIKTPIASSKLLIENNRSSVTKSIGEELDKIEGFVEQALYYTRSGSVHQDYIIKALNLREMINAAVKKQARQLIEAHVTVEIEDVEFTVYADDKWCEFILGQILTNAIQYRRDPAVIHISAREEEDGVVLAICDNGIGIPAKDAGRVFEKGFTGENGRRYRKSTGIGLYLCKKLCRKLGLRISLHENDDVGVTVTLTFPKNRFINLSESEF